MNFLKGYVDSVTNFVNNIGDVIDPIEKPENKDVECMNEEKNENTDSTQINEHNLNDTQVKSEEPGFLDWFSSVARPTTDSAMYYLNSLASIGSDSEKQVDLLSKPTDEVITQDVSNVATVSPTGEVDAHSPVDESSDPLLNWIDGISSRTEGIWKQMKHDFSEVVDCVSKDSKSMVTRTAESVRQRMSAAADVARKFDPDQFILPKRADGLSESEDSMTPLDRAELPSLEALRSDVSSLMDGFMSTLFGKSGGPATTSRREARLQILRADPGTYEHEPTGPAPLNYREWREAYFDEVTCQPRPGIPLCGARDISNEGIDADQLLQPDHDSPDALLTAHPFMRNYLTQLVSVDGQADRPGITDGDFWSRYYYRVWLLDVDERRRQRLTERVSGTATVTGSKPQDSNEVNEVTTAASSDANDWADAPEGDDPLDASSHEKSSSATTPVLKPLSDHASVQSPLKDPVPKTSVTATASKQKANRKKSRRSKASESDRSADSQSLSGASPSLRNLTEPFEKFTPSTTQLLPDKLRPDGTFEEFQSSGSSSVVVVNTSDDDRVCDPVLIDMIPTSESSTPTAHVQESPILSQSNSGTDTGHQRVIPLDSEFADRQDSGGDEWEEWS